MASSYLNRMTIKKLPIAATPLPLPIHGLVVFILLCIIFEWGRKIFNMLTSHQSSSRLESKTSLLSSSNNKNQDSELHKKQPSFRDGESVSRDDMETVFARLGIFWHPEAEDEKLEERLGSKDFCGLFGEEEDLDEKEVQAAFEVFDENKDGFIDEKELQRVLCALGFNEGLNMESCRNMINKFDEDGDGRIDFSDFCKLL